MSDVSPDILGILIFKALETDILVQIAPMNTIHADGIMTTLFLRSLSEFRIPKQRLLIFLSLFVLAVNIIGIKPNLNDFHNLSSLNLSVSTTNIGIIFIRHR